MEKNMPYPEIKLNLQTSVAELLQAFPQVIPVFISHRMACVGCSMASFDTLDEASSNYAIPGDQFLRELRQAIISQPRGEFHDPQPHSV
jgi:hybrid cluster-associated redox disulfide protein